MSLRSVHRDNKQRQLGWGEGTSVRKMQARAIDFDPQQYLVAECNEQTIELFKHLFDYVDDDHDGMLTPLDLRKALRQFGDYKPSKSVVAVAMSVFDSDKGGEITFKEFVRLMTQKPCQEDTDYDILQVFHTIDYDSKGYITKEDLKEVAREMHQMFSEKQFDEAIKSCDPNGDGKISPEAFLQFNKRNNFH